MMSLNRYRLRHKVKTGHRGARRAARLLEKPDSLISTILIGNNLINNLAAALATVLAIRLYGDNAVVPASILLTLVFLIFAEIIPKTIAAYKSEMVAYTVSHILLPLRSLLFPVIWLDHHQNIGDPLRKIQEGNPKPGIFIFRSYIHFGVLFGFSEGWFSLRICMSLSLP